MTSSSLPPREDEPTARGRILGRIRSALEGRSALPHPGAPPGVIPTVDTGELDLVDVFAGSLRKSGGEAVILQEIRDAVHWLGELVRDCSGAAVSPAVPLSLRPQLPEVDPSSADLGVSLALAGAAATGSLILTSSEGRALQLLPPTHLVWLEARSIRAELGEALEHVRGGWPLPAALAVHSGPSKSADIGRIVVTGVHGPGRLIAAVAHFSLSDL